MKRSRIKRMSDKSRARLAERAVVRETVMYGAKGRCEAGLGLVCSVRATEVHEVLTRGRSGKRQGAGSPLDADNCMALCRQCHRYITTHPEWALENGYVVHAVPVGATDEQVREVLDEAERIRRG